MMSVKSKNIHVLPTDKPSRLGYLTKKGKEVFKDLILFDRLMPNILDSENQNIYITSEVEIKKGDFFLGVNNVVYKFTSDDVKNGFKPNGKKIILTTDRDLIKDGVQAIDDEFLEWFIKNPSCEWVEVVEDIKYFNIDELRERHLKGLPHLYSEKIGYKIIIPREELKMIECYFTPKKDTSSATICNNCGQEKFLHTIGEGIKVSTYIVNPKEEPKQICEYCKIEITKYGCGCGCDTKEPKQDLEKEMFELEQELDTPSHLRWHNSKPKQETLEEAMNQYGYQESDYDKIWREGVEFGAKWQQEQIGKSEFLQKLRGTISDAEARRLIFETFKNK